MKDNYNFSKGTRGNFYKKDVKLNLPIYLDDQVYSFINEIAKEKNKDLSFIVNQLIYSNMKITETVS